MTTENSSCNRIFKWLVIHKWTEWTTILTEIDGNKVWMEQRACVRCGVSQQRPPKPE